MAKPKKRRLTVGRCCALDDNTKRCRRMLTRVLPYHGSSDLYGYFHEPWPGWVEVRLCPLHSEVDRG